MPCNEPDCEQHPTRACDYCDGEYCSDHIRPTDHDCEPINDEEEEQE